MKRPIVVLLAGVFAFALVAASAATLGGLTTDGLGANADVVAACTDGGIDVDFTTSFSQTAPSGYYVDAVVLTVKEAGDCLGADVDIALGSVTGGEGGPAAWQELSGVFSASGTATVTIPTTTDVLAQDVVSIDVLVTGPLPVAP
jgi:hypothetical protein